LPHTLGNITGTRFTKDFKTVLRLHKPHIATNLDTLELRRLRTDLVVCYKIVFGLIKVDVNKFFSFAPVSNTRGHRYKLFVEQFTRNVRHYFFCRRVVNIWNNLPRAVDFTTLVKFKRCLLQVDLSKYLLYCVD